MGLILVEEKGGAPTPPAKKVRTSTVIRTDDGRFMKPGAVGVMEFPVSDNTTRVRVTGYITETKEPETLSITAFNDTLILI